jgi:hypothetical protein
MNGHLRIETGWLAVTAATGTVALGLLGLLAPNFCARFVGLTARDRTGIGEFRATYGGLFVALGALPLWTGDSSAFLAASLAWSGAMVGRLVSIVVDEGWRERRNLAALAFEGVFALALATGV